MFDDTTPGASSVPVSGPLPGAPMAPMNAGNAPGGTTGPSPDPIGNAPYQRPPSMAGLPPLGMRPPTTMSSGGGRWKKILLIVILVLILIGGGIAVAALLFPGTKTTNTATTNDLTNAVVNLNAANINRANANTVTNANKNTNAAAVTNVNAATNTASNANKATNSTTNSTNVASNKNTANANVNAATNANANTNTAATNTNTSTAPASYTIDTDNDSLNNYLETWMKTSKTSADADGDSYLDGKEVASGYSPLHKGGILTVPSLEQYCTTSTLVTQYAFASADSKTFCGIAGDVLAKIQVMATNAAFYEDLDALLSTSCSSFGKIDKADCAATVQAVLTSYMLSGTTS